MHERKGRLVSNLATGKQFFGRESNSHYHLRMQCIKAVEPSFEAKEMVIPEESKLNTTIECLLPKVRTDVLFPVYTNFENCPL